MMVVPGGADMTSRNSQLTGRVPLMGYWTEVLKGYSQQDSQRITPQLLAPVFLLETEKEET
jgi:hypothetical protein